MRRLLFATSVLAAAVAAAPFAAAQPPADPVVKVQAVFGPEQFPMAGVTADVAPCAGGASVATLTTGDDGSATYNGAIGCYKVQVSAPIGCSLDGDAAQQVTSLPGLTPTALFHFRCA
ncbi:hypothetical protein ACIP5Y_44730 [Nocardia sp. NPDC088792]|uniref:hypothetical protein n=1 Tax=Nocardia sp. NPDC088792 TaxID=3364332 RepID=UPI00382FA0E7